MRELLLLYKSRGVRQLALFFAHQLARLYYLNYCNCPVVPVPPRAWKMHFEGWDQVDLLARLLRQNYRIPIVNLLRRLDGTRQKSLDRRQRFNHRQIFLLRQPALAARYVLLDDLLTTGTTLNRCAQLLYNHGATEVCGLTIAVVRQ